MLVASAAMMLAALATERVSVDYTFCDFWNNNYQKLRLCVLRPHTLRATPSLTKHTMSHGIILVHHHITESDKSYYFLLDESAAKKLKTTTNMLGPYSGWLLLQLPRGDCAGSQRDHGLAILRHLTN